MPRKTSLPDGSLSKDRPRMITFLSILIFLISLFHLLKLSQAIIQWDILSTIPLTVSPLYLAADGLVWWVSGLILTWALWTGQSWTRKIGLSLALIFAATFWIDLIWITEPDILQTRWLINLVFTVLGLSAMFIILNTASSRDFFN